MSSIYLTYFELEKSPFLITPDIDFFFSGSKRSVVLKALLHIANYEEGIVTVVSEVGTGKTLLARLMISKLSQNICAVYLGNPRFNRDEIISAISRDLGLTCTGRTSEENLAMLHEELLRRHAAGQRVIVIVDEAHAMPPDSIEEIRLLSNLESRHNKLVNIMLFGQPELDKLLEDRRLRQVADRVIHRIRLPALTKAEVEAYIDHRLRIAGWRGGHLFTPSSIALLAKLSQGRARRINLLADKAMLAAYAEVRHEVEPHHVKVAHNELQAVSTSWTRFSEQARIVVRRIATVLLVAAGAGGIFFAAQAFTLSSDPLPSTVLQPAKPNPAPPLQKEKTRPLSETGKADPVTASLTPAPDTPPTRSMATPSLPTPSNISLNTRELEEIAHRTDELMRHEEHKGYTLQIATLPGSARLVDYLGTVPQYIDPANLYAHQRIYAGKPALAVYFGNYPNRAAALAALAKLPEAIQANQPLLRTWNGIRQEPMP